MRGLVFIIFVFMSIWVFTVISCKQPYIAPATSSGANYLVVEGFINTGSNPSDSTVFKLSRTVTLSGKTSSKPELNATVTVIDSVPGATFNLDIPEAGKGKYSYDFALGLRIGHAGECV